MFFENRLIISYIYEANQQRYLFQLTGGEERTVTSEEFYSRLEEYRRFESRQAMKYEHEYRPLPITVAIHTNVDLYPINLMRRKAWAANSSILDNQASIPI